MKVVINRCYGGFSLSHEGVLHYAKLRGIKLYPEQDAQYRTLDIWTYWTVPPEERPKPIENWASAPIKERQAYNKALSNVQLYCRDLVRHDEYLVRTVEELGQKASGKFALLEVVAIPDGVEYVVEEYDGMEHIAEAHRSWP